MLNIEYKDNLVSKVIKDKYEIIDGRWPKKYNEVVLSVDEKIDD